MGLVYFSPQRLTLLRVHHVRSEGSRVVVRAQLDFEVLPETFQDIEVCKSLDLVTPMRISLYKLCAWDMPMIPLSLGDELTIELLDTHLAMLTNYYQFWGGLESEKEEEVRRRIKLAEKEAKRRQQAKRLQAESGGQPETQPRRTGRRAQRPANAGRVAPPGMVLDMVPVADGENIEPFRPGARILGEGEVDGILRSSEHDAEVAGEGLPGGEGLAEDWCDQVAGIASTARDSSEAQSFGPA